MGIPNVMNTGRSGMMAAKTAIATAGHNVANVNTEGYSRQRIDPSSDAPQPTKGTHAMVGQGVKAAHVRRVNDAYIEKQVRTASKELAHHEEKDFALKHAEDIFNELGGDGMNRLMSRFFNDFRQLANEPENEALRQSVRESSQAVVNDFHRLRASVDDIRRHLDSKIEGYSNEVNSLVEEVRNLNLKIKQTELTGADANDLRDHRDVALKKLNSYMDLSMHTDNSGNFNVEIRGVGPLVNGVSAEKFWVEKSPADDQGKGEGSFDLRTSASAKATITHTLTGGKLGALLEVRDKTLSTILEKLDELAFSLSESVNSIHSQGFTRHGVQGVAFFKPMAVRERASEFLALSDEVAANVNNIATAAQPDSPGDNRIAIAISGLQGMQILSEGKATFDDYYNSIMSDIGVVAARNRASLNQQKDIANQLGKIRDQISGVSIDEETTQLLQYQHAFDASAKVIQIADDMLKTVLDLRR